VLSDQLSDYEGEDGYTTAHVDIRSSRSARDFGRASGMLHTEEVTGSNPVSPTVKVLERRSWPTPPNPRPAQKVLSGVADVRDSYGEETENHRCHGST
jgi:hypothetical protein